MGFQITLDGRVLKTQGKKQLLCRTEKQAQIVAAEWDAQIDEIKPEEMPCTRLMNVACEMTPANRPELIAEFRKYCETDLLCYRTAEPRDLTERQETEWQPVLDWVAGLYGIALAVTDGLTALPQPESSLNAGANFATDLDDVALTLLLHFTASFGSAILALAVLTEHLSVDRAFSLSKLDEIFQNERWGEDDEAIANNAALLRELEALSKLI
ncbi:MAG: ATPase [Hyphomonadaceae bacterium]|nr:ATPase [Hyphomonadaceae bacterium]